MAISPFSARPIGPAMGSPDAERRRARLVVLIATIGIAAVLLAYATSPGVRRAVGHAEHSVKHAMTHVFDPDSAQKHHTQHARLVSPLAVKHAHRPPKAPAST